MSTNTRLLGPSAPSGINDNLTVDDEGNIEGYTPAELDANPELAEEAANSDFSYPGTSGIPQAGNPDVTTTDNVTVPSSFDGAIENVRDAAFNLGPDWLDEVSIVVVVLVVFGVFLYLGRPLLTVAANLTAPE